jgi:CBS domain-containing protein
MKVREVMTPFAESVHPDDMLRDAFERMRALDLDPMPVTDGTRLVGVLSSADVARRAAESGLSTATVPVREVMAGLEGCVRGDEDVEAALEMIESGEGQGDAARVPVVDADGALIGTVARIDLRRGHEDEHVTEGTAAVFAVESISSIADIKDDPVEYMNDASFPASDPPPPPSSFGSGEQD